MDLELILDVRAFDAQRAHDLENSVRAVEDAGDSAYGHSHGHEHGGHGSQSGGKASMGAGGAVKDGAHSDKIGTVAVTMDGPVDERKLNLWLGGLLWESDAGMCKCRSAASSSHPPARVSALSWLVSALSWLVSALSWLVSAPSWLPLCNSLLPLDSPLARPGDVDGISPFWHA